MRYIVAGCVFSVAVAAAAWVSVVHPSGYGWIIGLALLVLAFFFGAMLVGPDKPTKPTVTTQPHLSSFDRETAESRRLN